MLYPQWKEFLALSRTASLVPLAKSVSADLLTPVSAFLSIADDNSDAFLLESVEGGEKIGRYTFLGVDPYMRLVARGSEIVLERGRRRERVEGDLFQVVRSLLRKYRSAHSPGMPPFTGGAVGYFAYDSVRRLERLPNLAKDDLQVPDCVLMFFNRLLAFDHVRHQIHIVAAVDVSEESGDPAKKAYERALEDISDLERRLAAGVRRLKFSAGHPPRKIKVKSSASREQFMQSVRRAKDYIAAGDAFQVVLSQRLEFQPGAAPFDIYRALRTVNPSPYMYFLRMGKLGSGKLDSGGNAKLKDDGSLHVLGSSPELLVRVTGKKLEYRPIAGTLPRGASEAEDLQLEEKLRTDEKERAEHVMLVDLGRVIDYGSVQVRDLMYVERYSHVMHLVSAIQSTLRPDLDALDAFAACFPAGTLSGAPKVRAMEIIEELEPVRRGIYGGSVLYADFAGNLDSCIAIRTMLMKGKKAYVQAGAGIVADSDPQREYQESLNKAQALVRAAEMAG
jgi:anthranilate synthase component 1